MINRMDEGGITGFGSMGEAPGDCRTGPVCACKLLPAASGAAAEPQSQRLGEGEPAVDPEPPADSRVEG